MFCLLFAGEIILKILYVEDTLPNLILVERIAQTGHHDVISYPDAESALANFERDAPDLVLVDLQLAGKMSGIEMVEYLRAQGYDGVIAAITVTVTDQIRERCMRAGCNEFFAKPLEVHRFYRLIQRCTGWPLHNGWDDPGAPTASSASSG